MINRPKMILILFFVVCSVHISMGQDANFVKLKENNVIAKVKQSIQLASENLKEISVFFDEVKASLESDSLSLEERKLNIEKLKTLSVLQQAASDILRELISKAGSDKSGLDELGLAERDSLVINSQQVVEIARLVYADQVDPTLQAVFEMIANTSVEVTSEESQIFGENVPNIYANIGQTPIYQTVMEELHNTFRESATTPEGGGFGENDATPN